MDERLAVSDVCRGEDIVKKLARDFPINFRLWLKNNVMYGRVLDRTPHLGLHPCI
jgi:hypothetical protein